MRQLVLHIVIMIWILSLPGCRGQRQMETTETKQQTSEIGVEFHDLQRFWNSLAERLNFKIEFYPTDNGSITPKPDNSVPIDPTDSHTTSLPNAGGSGGSGGVGFGSVKSLEFSSERIAADSSFAQTDSTADLKSDSAASAHTEKASELRQDNGTWAIISIVAAVAFIVIVLIVIRKFFKK